MSDYQSPVLHGYAYDPPPNGPVKDPLEVRPYPIDFSCVLTPGDYITEILDTPVQPSGSLGDLIAVSSSIISSDTPEFQPPLVGGAVQVVVASGIVNVSGQATLYTLSALVSTNDGYQYNRSVIIPVNYR